MSLQVNLSGREINDAYQDVVAGRNIDWAVFTYDKGTNDLKVQSTGDGGLEELQEEFSDGRSVVDSCPAARLKASSSSSQDPVRICQSGRPKRSFFPFCFRTSRFEVPHLPAEQANQVRSNQLVR